MNVLGVAMYLLNIVLVFFICTNTCSLHNHIHLCRYSTIAEPVNTITYFISYTYYQVQVCCAGYEGVAPDCTRKSLTTGALDHSLIWYVIYGKCLPALIDHRSFVSVSFTSLITHGEKSITCGINVFYKVPIYFILWLFLKKTIILFKKNSLLSRQLTFVNEWELCYTVISIKNFAAPTECKVAVVGLLSNYTYIYMYMYQEVVYICVARLSVFFMLVTYI